MRAFVEALFRAVEPFPMMFGDILRFFEDARALEGQRQWRLVIGDKPFELDHFAEFEREWRSFECEFEVPAVNGREAFLPHTVRNSLEATEYLSDTGSTPFAQTGLADVDKWLEAYDDGKVRGIPGKVCGPKNSRQASMTRLGSRWLPCLWLATLAMTGGCCWRLFVTDGRRRALRTGTTG